MACSPIDKRFLLPGTLLACRSSGRRVSHPSMGESSMKIVHSAASLACLLALAGCDLPATNAVTPGGADGPSTSATAASLAPDLDPSEAATDGPDAAIGGSGVTP